MSNNTEAPISVTFRVGKGHDAPLFTVRGDDPTDFQMKINALSENGVGTVLGDFHKHLIGTYNVGNIIGGEPVNAPTNGTPQPEPAQQGQQAQSGPWQAGGQSQGQPAGGNGWGQPPQGQQAPQTQQAQPGSDFNTTNGPIVLGQPAKLVNGVGRNGRAWAAWADPRPREATDHITAKTDDPNDPRLVAGQAKFWQWKR